MDDVSQKVVFKLLAWDAGVPTKITLFDEDYVVVRRGGGQSPLALVDRSGLLPSLPAPQHLLLPRPPSKFLERYFL